VVGFLAQSSYKSSFEAPGTDQYAKKVSGVRSYHAIEDLPNKSKNNFIFKNRHIDIHIKIEVSQFVPHKFLSKKD
jgi:hypothetical protein